jgi:hypothetical protein
MMALSAHVRVLVCIATVDFRKGIDGLARVCREVLSIDPFSGTVFVFRNRRGTAIKLLAYDGQGFWLCQKRLSEGKFRRPLRALLIAPIRHFPAPHGDRQQVETRKRRVAPRCGAGSIRGPRSPPDAFARACILSATVLCSGAWVSC